jgi:uncharacterized membrane protein
MNEQVHALAEQLLATGLDKLSQRECRVITGVARRTQVSRNVNHAFAERQTFGDRLADRVATFGGSWTFITLFSAALIGWAVLNSIILAGYIAAFDPYPYIFLNLILSMVAALQAPIIMMSQNRQAARDRLAAGLDYEVVVGKLLDKGDVNFGYDAQGGTYGDMLKAGIIDPTKVVRLALQDAASVAGLLVTTEAMVAEKPERKEPAMSGGGMGGMDF